jgi:hypothetical protein
LNEISAVNIAATAMITQFSLGCILSTGAWLLREEASDETFWTPKFRHMPWVLLAFWFFALGALFFSEPVSALWRPLFGSLPLLIPLPWAMLAAFLTDVLVVFFLAWRVDGARSLSG